MYIWLSFLLLAIVSLCEICETFYLCNKFTFTVFLPALSEAAPGLNPFFISVNKGSTLSKNSFYKVLNS